MPSQSQSYSEELDPTTARLVSELAAQMLPSLTKALNTALPANDFSGAIERSNRISQDLRSQIEKSIKSSIEDSRAGRSVMMQSIGTLLDEILSLKRSIEKVPANIESAITKAVPVKEDNDNMNKTSREYEKISELLNELITGLRSFTETYARDNMKRELEREQERETAARNASYDFAKPDPHTLEENNTRLDKLLNNALPSLEGLLKSQGKTQSQELADFSREISASQEQNNAALIHEVRDAVNEELANFNNELMNQMEALQTENTGKIIKVLRFLVILSGSSVVLLLIAVIMLLLR